jgi:hypothetical protein
MRIDAAVSAEVLSLIAPLGLEAALQAIADRERDGTQRLRQIELALEQARYEAARSHRTARGSGAPGGRDTRCSRGFASGDRRD